jgi:AcrR family transcriptional regulator
LFDPSRTAGKRIARNEENTVAIHQNHARLPVKPDRRQALILAAYRAIAEKGFEGLRVREVAADVGMNGATLHHYFPTKEVLIQSVVEYVIARLSLAFADLSGTPAEQLHAHLTRLHRLMQEEPALFVVLTEINLRAQRDPVLHYLVQQENIWHERLVSILQAGVEQQNWPPDLDPTTTAAAIIALIEGASLWAAILPDRAEHALRQLEQWLLTL